MRPCRGGTKAAWNNLIEYELSVGEVRILIAKIPDWFAANQRQQPLVQRVVGL